MIYLDSSALVKRYIQEEGSGKIDALLEKTSIVATSRLAYPEVLAAITRRYKAGEIEMGVLEGIKQAFKVEWTSLAVVAMHTEVFQFVDGVIARHALKGADSRHLSTALCSSKR